MSYEVNVDTLGPDSAIPCNPAMNVIQDNCLYEKMAMNLTETFGCSIPYIPDQRGEPVCDPEVGKDLTGLNRHRSLILY